VIFVAVMVDFPIHRGCVGPSNRRGLLVLGGCGCSGLVGGTDGKTRQESFQVDGLA
jgi:hypothetical protein